MFCPKCGTFNGEDGGSCTRCGRSLDFIVEDHPQNQLSGPFRGAMTDPNYRGEYGQYPKSIKNYLIPAILVTIFLFFPFGIVAIIYAANVDRRMAKGDYAGAIKMSYRAKTWCWVTFWAFIFLFFGFLALFFISLSSLSGRHLL